MKHFQRHVFQHGENVGEFDVRIIQVQCCQGLALLQGGDEARWKVVKASQRQRSQTFRSALQQIDDGSARQRLRPNKVKNVIT